MFTKALVLLLAILSYPSCGSILNRDRNRTEYDPRDFLNERIVGGVEAPPGYGKHTVALVYGEMITFHMCGASIISKNHILTAAHCIDPFVIRGQLMPSFLAVIGSNKWASTENNIGFKKYINHPGWDWDTIKNDIGILFLAKEIQLDANVAVIPLNAEFVGGGAKSHVTGWGRLWNWFAIPKKLQLLYVETMTPEACIAGVQKAAEEWGSALHVDPNIEICTFHSINHGMCHGDSGSALVKDDTQDQIGIVSWGFLCARGAPDVFVRTSAFIDWVQGVIAN